MFKRYANIDSLLHPEFENNDFFSFKEVRVKRIERVGYDWQVYRVKNKNASYILIDFLQRKYASRLSQSDLNCTVLDLNHLLEGFSAVEKIQFLTMFFAYSQEKFLTKWSVGHGGEIVFDRNTLKLPNDVIKSNPFIIRKVYQGYDLFGIEGGLLSRYFLIPSE